MSDLLSFNPVRAVDRNGDPVPGARAFFFRTGTSTPATVYTSPSLGTPHPVPLVADGRGNFPAVFASDSFAFKVDVRTPDGVSLPGFPLDPVIRVPSSTAGASQITFAPFSSISATNVQSAIEQVFNAISGGAAAFGIGVTGNAPTVENVDATNLATGFYRFTDEATGTLPNGWAADNATGTLWMIRETASNGVMVVSRRAANKLFFRRLVGGDWQSWVDLTPPPPVVNSGTPPGAIIWVAYNGVPAGYLKADGAAVSRTTYAELYAVIGDVFGAGDGSTTFNLPDLRGEFVRGFDDGRGVDGGRAFGSAQADELASHNHSLSFFGASGSSVTRLTGSATASLSLLGGTNTNRTGGDETRPRNVALLAVIKY